MVKIILRHLKGTIDYTLCYQDNYLYNDVGLRGDFDERKSTCSFVFLLSNGIISWSSKKQCYIGLSTMDVKFMAILVVVQKTIRLKYFLVHLVVSGSVINLN